MADHSNFACQCCNGLARRRLFFREKEYRFASGHGAFACNYVAFRRYYVSGLHRIALSTDAAFSLGQLLSPVYSLVLVAAPRLFSLGAVTPEFLRSLLFSVAYVDVFRIIEFLQYAVIAAPLPVAGRLRAVFRSECSDTVGVISMRLLYIAILSRVLRHGSVGYMRFHSEGFYLFVDAPAYIVHERRGCRAFRRLEIPQLAARAVLFWGMAEVLAYGREICHSV